MLRCFAVEFKFVKTKFDLSEHCFNFIIVHFLCNFIISIYLVTNVLIYIISGGEFDCEIMSVITFVIYSTRTPLTWEGVIWWYPTPHIRGRHSRTVAGILLETTALLHYRRHRQRCPHRALLTHRTIRLLSYSPRHLSRN